uniref:Uncharacterized protein n=1 Tax=Arundo donax TaxID=35708 RepID=A0A0A9G4C2_ARUDO
MTYGTFKFMKECTTCLNILKLEVALSSRQGKRMWLL